MAMCPVRSRSPRGAILVEVLMAVGLLSMVMVFLLSVFRTANRIDREMERGLEEIRTFQRMFESLRTDLLRTQGVVVNERDLFDPSFLVLAVREEGAGGASGLGSRVCYRVDAARKILERSVAGSGEEEQILPLGEYGSIEFKLLTIQPPSSTGVKAREGGAALAGERLIGEGAAHGSEESRSPRVCGVEIHIGPPSEGISGTAEEPVPRFQGVGQATEAPSARFRFAPEPDPDPGVAVEDATSDFVLALSLPLPVPIVSEKDFLR